MERGQECAECAHRMQGHLGMGEMDLGKTERRKKKEEEGRL
jgi:hypothetical protein